MKWLRRVITRPKTPRWFVVEIPKGVALGADDDRLIATLSEHPGMTALLNRFRLKKAVLEAQLRSRQKDIRDVDYLVAGIHWLGFVESEISTAIQRTSEKSTPRLATFEVAEFERARSAIESIGDNA